MFAPASSHQLLCHALQPTKLRPAQLGDEETEHFQDASGDFHPFAGAVSRLTVVKHRLTQCIMRRHADGVIAQVSSTVTKGSSLSWLQYVLLFATTAAVLQK